MVVKPYYQDDWCTIYNADCRDVLPKIGQVGLVLTDPPYGVNLAFWDKFVPHDLLTPFLAMSTGAVIWFGAAPQMVNDIRMFDTSPERVVIWAPRFTLSRVAANGLAFRWHPVYCWNLPKKPYDKTFVWDIINYPTGGHCDWSHPATKPLKLITGLMQFCPPDGTVLDPFMGSGTTLRAAKDLKRKAIGIEISKEYCDIAVKRLRQEVLL